MADAPTTTAADVLAGTDLAGTHALVTGATTGIGKETARALLAAGATVTVTARSDAKGAAAVEDLRAAVPDAAVGYGVLELASLASVRAFADGFAAEHDRLTAEHERLWSCRNRHDGYDRVAAALAATRGGF